MKPPRTPIVADQTHIKTADANYVVLSHICIYPKSLAASENGPQTRTERLNNCSNFGEDQMVIVLIESQAGLLKQ